MNEKENPDKEEQEHPVSTDQGEAAKLILFNDDFNTFDFVISCLVNICSLSEHQAEQITLLVHHKGKARVKEGDPETLEDMCQQLVERGLTAEVQ